MPDTLTDLCRCGHPDHYHRDGMRGLLCDHYLCDCPGYEPAPTARDRLSTGIAVGALALTVLGIVVWSVPIVILALIAACAGWAL